MTAFTFCRSVHPSLLMLETKRTLPALSTTAVAQTARHRYAGGYESDGGDGRANATWQLLEFLFSLSLFLIGLLRLWPFGCCRFISEMECAWANVCGHLCQMRHCKRNGAHF